MFAGTAVKAIAKADAIAIEFTAELAIGCCLRRCDCRASAAVNTRCAFCERRQSGAACRPNQRQLARRPAALQDVRRARTAERWEGGGWE